MHASNPIVLACLYGTCLYLFCLGLIRLFRMFIPNENFVILGTICILIPIKYISIGANELFYNMPVSGVFCKTLCIWAILFWLKEKQQMSYLLLIPASLFHVLAGLQVFILIFLVELFKNRKQFLTTLRSASIYLFIVLPYLAFIINSRKSPHSHDNSMVDLIEFRIGHHFFIQYNSLLEIFISGILFSLGIYLSRIYSRKILYFFVIQISILLCYIIAVNGFRLEFALQLQWLKTTILLELFSIIFISKYLSEIVHIHFKLKLVQFCTLGIIGLFLLIIFIKNTKKQDHINREEIQLAEWANKNTLTESLFLYPPIFTSFKSISERSSWIDFKAISHQKAYLIPWYDRVQKVFNIDLQDRRNKTDLIQKANLNYSELNNTYINNLMKEQNINYAILPTRYQNSSQLRSVFSTGNYTIYKTSSN